MYPQDSYNNKSQRPSSYNNRPQRYNNRPQRPYNNKFQKPYNNKFQRSYHQRPEYNSHHNAFDFYRTGTNSRGNHWCHRGPSKARGGNYHYSNKHSFYYQNSNGSTYYENENGRRKYTPPSRNSRTHQRRYERTDFRT
ncbi:16658_t:CDS:1 [Dentiscutata heterogama]|uniref:16658_t:CDS:1 n=1 Tax=Dentiscutata heterogama TaxID=1316150 RepID=A0ACA9KF30_9GLOM|nr:16658_t:CDS:1 [Dentiscutata heterogama]